MNDATASPPGPRIVVMGVSAAGKSTFGRALARTLSLPFLDADDLHAPSAIEKMRGGAPLDDEDREPWLERCGAAVDAATAGAVLACSALARKYRDAIRRRSPDAIFVHLAAPREALARRAASRSGHFMPPELLASQFAVLEPLISDERGFEVDAMRPLDVLLDETRTALGAFAR